MFYKFLNRARRCLENKSLLDDGRIDQLEGGMKQMELVANEAERKYEEVCNHGIYMAMLWWPLDVVLGSKLGYLKVCLVLMRSRFLLFQMWIAN